MEYDLPSIYAEIDKQASQFGVDPLAAKALLTAENTGSGSTTSRASYNAASVSPAGARGLFQVMPKTAQGLQAAGLLPVTWKNDPTDLGSQVSAGLAAIKDMTSRMKNPDDLLELAAYYNGGNAGRSNYLSGTLTNPETVQYLKKVSRANMELGTQLTPQQIEQRAAQGPGMAASGDIRRSAGTSVSRSTIDPNALDNILGSMQAMNSPGGIYDQAYGAITDRGGQVAQAGFDLQSTITAVGQAAGATAQAKAEQEAAGVVVRQGILAASNLDPRATDNRMQAALTRMDAASVQLDQMRPEIDAAMALNPLESPLQWLIAQIQLPSQVAAYNNVQREQADAIGAYHAAQGIASSQISLGTALDADKILDVGAKEATQAAAEADAKKRTVQLQLAGKSAADALNTVHLAQQKLQGEFTYAQLTKQRETERQQAADAARNRKLDEQALGDLNQLITAAGGTAINWERLKQLPAKTREDLLTAATSRKFGSTFGEAMQFVDSVGSINGMAQGGQLGVVNWVQKSLGAANALATQAQTAATARGDKSFNPQKAKLNAMDTIGAQYQTQAEGNMAAAADGNPFKLDYQNAAKAPELANNVWAKVINTHGPSGDGTIPKLTEQDLMRRAVIDILAKPTGADTAAAVKQYARDIANFYQTATAKQALDTKYTLFGLYKPSKTYGVNMPEYMTKPTEVLDLGNPAAVENFLTKETANQFRKALMLGGPFGLSRT